MSQDDPIEKLFGKKFHFTRMPHWKLPDTQVIFTQDYFLDPTLQAQKIRLNSVKSKLNDLELEVWSTHTCTQSPSPEIIQKIRDTFTVEFITQAWTKFYECLSTFPIIPVMVQNLNTVHLCEAPGAFVVALNHFLATKRCLEEWSWCASTLNVYYDGNSFGKMIADDRFIHTTLDRWEFGADLTGDITCTANVEQLVERCTNMGEIHLITADGSINCTDAPDCQEEFVAHLHIAETVTALKILSLGGCFVLKMFTFFECPTICLLYFLASIFRSISIFKPATSKGGNSEVYVICEFLEVHPPEEFLNKLFNNMSNREASFLPEATVPRDFLQQLYECTEFFANLQIDVIEGNLATFNRETVGKAPVELVVFKEAAFDEFCRRYKLENLPECATITKPNAIPNFWRHSPRINEGSHTERSICRTASQMKEIHRKHYSRYQLLLIYCQRHSQLRTSSLCQLHPIYGKRYRKISCSVFAHSGLLFYFLQAVKDCLVPSTDAIPNCRLENSRNVLRMEMKTFCHVTDHAEYFRDVIATMWRVLKESNAEKMVLCNFCPLSQLTGGLLFLFAKERQARIHVNCRQNEISIDISKSHIRARYCSIIECIEELIRRETPDRMLLSLIDIRDIYANAQFHKILRCYNNQIVMKMFHELIS